MGGDSVRIGGDGKVVQKGTVTIWGDRKRTYPLTSGEKYHLDKDR